MRARLYDIPGTRDGGALSCQPHKNWLKLSHLIKADDPSPFPALTQIEVYGTDTER